MTLKVVTSEVAAPARRLSITKWQATNKEGQRQRETNKHRDR